MAPGVEWDEPVYYNVAHHLLHGDGLELKPQLGESGIPYLFHPPFYFLVLAAWLCSVGDSLEAARQLAAVMSVATILICYFALKKAIGRYALIATAAIAFDGWLIFTNRVAWIENSMMVLAVGAIAMVIYTERRRSDRWYLVIGALAGAAVVFKHIAVFFLVAILIDFAFVRRERRSTRLVASAAIGVVVVYLITMTIVFQADGKNYFWEANITQIKRVGGLEESRGTVSSPTTALRALKETYSMFYVTIAVFLFGILLSGFQTFSYIRRRERPEPGPTTSMLCIVVVGLLMFAAMRLRFPHYAGMLLLPMYMYIAMFLADRISAKSFSQNRRWRLATALTGVGILLLLFNAATFRERFLVSHGDALLAVQDFAAESIPKQAVVITEEPIGTMIGQPYCKMFRAPECAARAKYLIVYVSHTQAPPVNAALFKLAKLGIPVAVFNGFKESIYAIQVNPPLVVSPERLTCGPVGRRVIDATEGSRREAVDDVLDRICATSIPSSAALSSPNMPVTH